jgi:hypothetical protein
MPYHRDTFGSQEAINTGSSRAITAAATAAQVILYYLVDFMGKMRC